RNWRPGSALAETRAAACYSGVDLLCCPSDRPDHRVPGNQLFRTAKSRRITMKPIEVGDVAPEFTATASDGQSVSLADFKGKQVVVIFFYPRDNSPICTREACAFRDAYEDFVKLGAVVIGVSGDSDQSHRAFAAAQRLPYLLIADSDGA